MSSAFPFFSHLSNAISGGGGGSYVLPAATNSSLGGVQVGGGLAITLGGILSTVSPLAIDVTYSNTASGLTAVNAQSAIDELVELINSPINAILYVDNINGKDKETGGGMLDPLKTLTFAQTQLPSAGGTITLLGSISESFTQTLNNVTIQGTGAQWSPASFITGTITQPTGLQRLRLKDIAVTGNINIQGLGNNYFQNLNGGNCIFNGSSGYNEFWMCESSSKTITNHTGTIASNLGRNLTVTQTSGTSIFAAQFCQGGQITMQTAGTVFLSRCNTLVATHHAGALFVDRCGGFALSSDAPLSATNIIKIFSSDFFDPTSTTFPAGYFVCSKTGTCPIVYDSITKFPSPTPTLTGTKTIVDTNTPTAGA